MWELSNYGICSQVVDHKGGERGRNRTFNLLIFNQQPKTNGFNDFPSFLVVTNRQI
jgi:hypothetical protein